MFEHRRHPLLHRRAYLGRLARSGMIAAAIVSTALALGIMGYHFFEHLSWIDALLNAAMLLSGMGPIHAPQSTTGKLFASGYALFSGIVFLTVSAVLFAPVAHRLLHRFHLELSDDDAKTDGPKQR